MTGYQKANRDMATFMKLWKSCPCIGEDIIGKQFNSSFASLTSFTKRRESAVAKGSTPNLGQRYI
jgi:hypothetical protein